MAVRCLAHAEIPRNFNAREAPTPPYSHNLLDLEFNDVSRIKIDALLKCSAQTTAIERDDPTFLDDQILNHPIPGQRRPADGGVLPPRRAAGDEKILPLLWQHFRQSITRW